MIPGCEYIHRRSQRVYKVLFLCPVSAGDGEDGHAKWVPGVVYESVEEGPNKGFRYARSQEGFNKSFEHYERCRA